MTTAAAIRRGLVCANPRCSCHQAARTGRGLVHCPAHEDDRPSLSIREVNGTILWHCFAGCSQEAILTKLRQRGLWPGSSRPAQHNHEHPSAMDAMMKQPKTSNSIDPLHWWAEYCQVPLAFVQSLPVAADGNRLAFLFGEDHAVRKLRTANAKKEYEWSPAGVPVPPLWPLPTSPGATIIICEGESDCTVARALGLEAYALTRGAGGALTLPQAEALARLGVKRVILVLDADDAGREGAKRLADVLSAAGLSVTPLALDVAGLVNPLAGGKDLRDAWLATKQAGGSIDDLVIALARAATESATISARREWNAAELARTGKPDIAFLPFLGQTGYIPRGWCTLVAGYPKVGKTELTTRLCASWQSERILYVSEEPEAIWAARLNRTPGDWGHVQILLALGLDPKIITSRITTGDETVVVIDTVRSLLGLQDETDNTEIARVLTPVIAAARNAQKTLLLLHHLRKGGGEHGEAISGGHAFLGIVDAALEISRDQGAADLGRRRLVRGWSRLFPIAEAVYELAEDGSMRFLGSQAAVRLDEVKQRVLATLSEDWQTRKEIHENMDDPKPSMEQLRVALNELVLARQIERDPPEDRKRATYRYRLPTGIAPPAPLRLEV